ncbi:helix-turn-helix transcriptional regulator [Streptomyces cylindrosporus]|uniref:LuxR C-terminal-related transcriptional regulator n=1 Tax=Streptomyces cylindrosporus TaxID=2927583 RepID=A0ABS9YLL2_9ACTN|nr:LuxR C-terminal-related transcriptional regulator [Streptomyces cylindrosporus]MCI3278104.1 LuxR C-terminal-related transcriptional regulator [Streptomyces cylindrosporus]
MTTFERDAKTLELPWPFTGREDELELIRRSLTAGHHGIVVTGPEGCGKTRLATEAVRGGDRARAAGTPETRHIPFAAFTHLLPETVSLHRAVQLLSGVRLLLIDDAQLLDDASAALVHQLAVHGRTRLIVVAADGAAVPGAVSRLWTGELLPRLALEPLPREDTEQLLATAVGGPVEPLTLNRLLHLSRGDLRLLRDLVDAVRERGLLTRDRDTDAWAWRGPVPMAPAIRDRAAEALDRPHREERTTLERLAFSEPLPLHMDGLDLHVLEGLETDDLIRIDDDGAVRLSHPLHGPVLRAAAGRLRARRLARTPDQQEAALAAEAAELTARIEHTDVRALPAPAGEWPVREGAPLPAGYAAARARYSRLRGELREAAAWAREGLRHAPGDATCRTELALAAAQSGDTATVEGIVAGAVLADGGTAVGGAAGVRRTPSAEGAGAGGATLAGEGRSGDGAGGMRRGAPSGVAAGAAGASVAGEMPSGEGAGGAAVAGEALADVRAGDAGAVDARAALSGEVAVWLAVVRGDVEGAILEAFEGAGTYALYDAVRLGAPEKVAGLLPAGGVFARHADALARSDGPGLDRAAEALEEQGFLLFAAEAHAQAVRAHRDPHAARTSRTRAVALARRCQGARTPALAGLVLGELTARQRQIVTLAAAGLSNRQIAERLTLSIRTVGNHLYSAYARLGASDRAALPWLMEPPTAQPA